VSVCLCVLIWGLCVCVCTHACVSVKIVCCILAAEQGAFQDSRHNNIVIGFFCGNVWLSYKKCIWRVSRAHRETILCGKWVLFRSLLY